MQISLIFETVYKKIKTIDISDIKKYLYFLEKIKNDPENSQFKPAEKHLKEYLTLEKNVKSVFHTIQQIALEHDLSDEYFYILRTKLTKEKKLHELAMSSNLDTLFSISKNYDFQLHIHQGRVAMESILNAHNNFLKIIRDLEKKPSP